MQYITRSVQNTGKEIRARALCYKEPQMRGQIKVNTLGVPTSRWFPQGPLSTAIYGFVLNRYLLFRHGLRCVTVDFRLAWLWHLLGQLSLRHSSIKRPIVSCLRSWLVVWVTVHILHLGNWGNVNRARRKSLPIDETQLSPRWCFRCNLGV